MNKYLKYLLILLISFLLLTNVSAKENKVTLYFFHGDGCPHCAAEEEFLKKNKDNLKDVEIVKYEVWNNEKNRELLKSIGKKFDMEVSSIPFNIIGNTIIKGYLDDSSTGQKLLNAIYYYQDNDYHDYVQDYLNGDKTVIEVNEEAIKYKRSEEQKSVHTIKIPLIGEVDLEKISLSFATILIGLVDGFNPCAMWVLLFLISALIGMKDRKRMFTIGFAFILTSGLVYLAILLSWINIVVKVSTSVLFRNIIALVAIIGGLINLRSYINSLKEEDGCDVVDDKKRKKIFTKIKTFTKEKSLILAILGAMGLAVSVNIVELACSAGLPLVFSELLTINNISGISSLPYVLLYILFFLIDDIIVFTIAIITMTSNGISSKFNKYSHLVGGIIMLIIGLLLIFKPGWLMFTFK